jgi:hypothetical protein
MRNGQHDLKYSGTPPVRRCGHCGEPLISQRRRAKYCSREHKELAREARKRASGRLTRLHGNHPFADASLAELHEHASAPQHWAEAGPVDGDLPEFSDYHDVGVYEDQDDEDGQSWNVAYRVQQAVQQIEGEYRELARPLLAQQKRNPGVRLPALVQIEAECEQKINALLRKHQRAQALERAARLAPQRVATAHERELEQAAARAFAQDLGRGRFLRADPEPAGRDVYSAWLW